MTATAAPAASVEVQHEAGGLSTLDFLRKILPTGPGLYVIDRIVGGFFRHQVCSTVEEAATYALSVDAQGVPVYHACSSFREPFVEKVVDGKTKRQVRTHGNVLAVKSLWADLDVDPANPKKYASQEAAIDGLIAFCDAAALPIPTTVNSGFGVHCYFVFTENVSPDAWKVTAEAFKVLAVHCGFLIDPACSADQARVLRPIGTMNRKRLGDPRAVELIADAEPIAHSDFHKLVLQALSRLGVKAPEVIKSRETAPEAINADFAVQRDFPPCSAAKVAEKCAQMRLVRDDVTKISEPHFYASLQIIANSTEGAELAHAWASRYPGYDRASGWVDKKLEQVRGMGPTLCTTFESRNPGGCTGCPFKGTISSPARLGHAQLEDLPIQPQPVVAPPAGLLPSSHVEAPATTAGAAGVPAAGPGTLAQPSGLPPAASGAGFGFSTTEDAAALALVMHSPTEDHVARFFERRGSGILRYCKTWGYWLSWDGARWRSERTDLAFDFARSLAREVNPAGKAAIAKAAFARGVESFARASRCFATESGDWDRNEFLLNTPGGTVDLRTGAMRPHDRSDLITNVTRVIPCAGPKPVFDRFMSEITLGDTSLVNYHQRSLGAILSGALADHWLLFWIGAGRNGKNTLGDLLAWILADYAKTIPSETMMSVKSQGHPTELANLRGIRLAMSSEVAEGAHWNESRIKSLTGDTTISARFMRGDFFEFQRTHKHRVYGNHRPMLRVVDDAIRARMHVVPFRATFSAELGNRDPLLPEKLREEGPQILAWLIEGHMQWVEAGFTLTPCLAVQQETAEYLATQSTPALWVTERCEVIENDDRPTKDLPRAGVLYKDYTAFKEARGEHVPSMTRWGDWMAGRHEKVESNGVRYRGLRLKPMELDTVEWVHATRPSANNQGAGR